MLSDVRRMIAQWWPDAMRLSQTGKAMRILILFMTSFQNKYELAMSILRSCTCTIGPSTCGRSS